MNIGKITCQKHTHFVIFIYQPIKYQVRKHLLLFDIFLTEIG